MVDTLIQHGIILTMNPKRQIIHDGAIAIEKNRILDVGETKHLESKYAAKIVINASHKVVMPGLIDTHGHSGHNLVKTVAEHLSDDWISIVETFYKEATTPKYWQADGALGALERLKFGTTCGVSYLGSCPRTDEPIYALKHIEGTKEIGIRDVVAVGPGRPPYPNTYVKWDHDGPKSLKVSFEENLKVSEEIVRTIKDREHRLFDMVLSPPAITLNSLTADGKVLNLPDVEEKADLIKRLMEKWNLKLHTHAYSPQIQFAADNLDLLGPTTSLAHCTGLTKEEIQILAKSNTKVCYSPSARAIIPARCPVVELLDAGVTVAISTDGSAPDRTFDLFKDLRHAMSVQRHYFRDEMVMPPGKVLEMITIDAARTLGYEKELGSLEVGKKADIILIDMMKPHLLPIFMIPHRIAYEVSGHDVDMVIVDGQVLMDKRQVLSIDEKKILETAQEEAENAIERGNLEKYMEIPANFWGKSRY